MKSSVTIFFFYSFLWNKDRTLETRSAVVSLWNQTIEETKITGTIGILTCEDVCLMPNSIFSEVPQPKDSTPTWTQVANSSFSFVALSLEGKLYTWGRNNAGKLGQGDDWCDL